MQLATSISLPPNVQQQIFSAAPQFSVDSWVLAAIAQVMSGGQQFASDGGLLINNLGGVGVMGISVATANTLGYNATDEGQNILAAAAYMARLLGSVAGNYSMAVAAYFSGLTLVLQYSGVPPIASVQQFVYNVTALARRAGSNSMDAKTTLENQATFDPTPGAQTQQLITPVGQSIDPNNTTQQQSLTPGGLQIDTGLTETPWYTLASQGVLLTGNPRIRQFVQPVSFIVYLSRTQNIFLHNPTDQTPIQIQLNTSITTFELQSKHIFSRTPSRTGMHITFWGMAPDLISGSGSTGVFMNQFGVTDFMSVADVTDDVKQLVTSGFARSFKPNAVVRNAGSTGEVFTATVTGSNTNFDTVVAAQSIDPNNAFRVAAQDAFVEFLKLFQMNGNVWFYSQNYKGSYTSQQQTNVNSWSESTGTTSFEQAARNNDVMSRGYVTMRYRNNVYLGYFKSLNWTQDADSPFQWKFNFTFQVEKTYSALYWPNFSVTQFSTLPPEETLL